MSIDFDHINACAMNCLESLLREWLPGGEIHGTEYVCGSWGGEPGRSLSINLRSGKGGDFAAGDLAGDPIGIYAARFEVDRVTAAKALAGVLGISGGDDSYSTHQKTIKPTAPKRHFEKSFGLG